MSKPNSAPTFPDPEEFLEVYGPAAPVVAGGQEMTLGQALQFEAMFCPANKEARQDPGKRVPYLAGMLAAAGTLLPEHEWLLLPNETD